MDFFIVGLGRNKGNPERLPEMLVRSFDVDGLPLIEAYLGKASHHQGDLLGALWHPLSQEFLHSVGKWLGAVLGFCRESAASLHQSWRSERALISISGKDPIRRRKEADLRVPIPESNAAKWRSLAYIHPIVGTKIDPRIR